MEITDHLRFMALRDVTIEGDGAGLPLTLAAGDEVLMAAEQYAAINQQHPGALLQMSDPTPKTENFGVIDRSVYMAVRG
jgi:hypothetical protein